MIYRIPVCVSLLAGLVLLAPMRGHCVNTVEGIARSLPAGEEVYTETHEFSGNGHHISYRDPAGALIAEKRLDYSCSESAPDWEQHDLRSGKREGGHWSGETYVLQRDDRSNSITPDGTLVASSGFDKFVRRNWEKLTSGTQVGFEFALPARLTTIGMRISKTSALPGEQGISEWFRVEPSSPLFRMLAGAIVLGYDEERQLQFYRGPSNIGDAKGGDLDVEIRYRRSPATAGLAPVDAPQEPQQPGGKNHQCPRSDA